MANGMLAFNAPGPMEIIVIGFVGIIAIIVPLALIIYAIRVFSKRSSQTMVFETELIRIKEKLAVLEKEQESKKEQNLQE